MVIRFLILVFSTLSLNVLSQQKVQLTNKMPDIKVISEFQKTKINKAVFVTKDSVFEGFAAYSDKRECEFSNTSISAFKDTIEEYTTHYANGSVMHSTIQTIVNNSRVDTISVMDFDIDNSTIRTEIKEQSLAFILQYSYITNFFDSFGTFDNSIFRMVFPYNLEGDNHIYCEISVSRDSTNKLYFVSKGAATNSEGLQLMYIDTCRINSFDSKYFYKNYSRIRSTDIPRNRIHIQYYTPFFIDILIKDERRKLIISPESILSFDERRLNKLINFLIRINNLNGNAKHNSLFFKNNRSWPFY